METRTLTRRLSLGLVLGLLSLGPQAGWAASALTVAPEPGLTETANGTPVFDAGTVDPQKTPHVDHTFTLRNAGTTPATIMRLHGSCGCESLLLIKAGQTVTRATLAPGESAQVHVAVRTAGQPAGVLHKYIWVESASATAPLATLEVQLQVRDPALAAPTFLNFGSVASGTSHVLSLTLTVDSDTLPGDTLPSLVSSNAAVEIRPAGPPEFIQRDDRPSIRQAYQVTLADTAPAGRLSGSLHFVTDVHGLATLTVPLAADITGQITAAPKTLFFGSVIAGRAVTRQVLLNLARPEAGSAVSVSGGGPWLTTTLHVPDAGVVRLLDVTLSAHAPSGLLQSQITIVAGGDRLILPVVADVVRPTP